MKRVVVLVALLASVAVAELPLEKARSSIIKTLTLSSRCGQRGRPYMLDCEAFPQDVIAHLRRKVVESAEDGADLLLARGPRAHKKNPFLSTPGRVVGGGGGVGDDDKSSSAYQESFLATGKASTSGTSKPAQGSESSPGSNPLGTRSAVGNGRSGGEAARGKRRVAASAARGPESETLLHSAGEGDRSVAGLNKDAASAGSVFDTYDPFFGNGGNTLEYANPDIDPFKVMTWFSCVQDTFSMRDDNLDVQAFEGEAVDFGGNGPGEAMGYGKRETHVARIAGPEIDGCPLEKDISFRAGMASLRAILDAVIGKDEKCREVRVYERSAAWDNNEEEKEEEEEEEEEREKKHGGKGGKRASSSCKSPEKSGSGKEGHDFFDTKRLKDGGGSGQGKGQGEGESGGVPSRAARVTGDGAWPSIVKDYERGSRKVVHGSIAIARVRAALRPRKSCNSAELVPDHAVAQEIKRESGGKDSGPALGTIVFDVPVVLVPTPTCASIAGDAVAPFTLHEDGDLRRGGAACVDVASVPTFVEEWLDGLYDARVERLTVKAIKTEGCEKCDA